MKTRNLGPSLNNDVDTKTHEAGLGQHKKHTHHRTNERGHTAKQKRRAKRAVGLPFYFATVHTPIPLPLPLQSIVSSSLTLFLPSCCLNLSCPFPLQAHPFFLVTPHAYTPALPFHVRPLTSVPNPTLFFQTSDSYAFPSQF